MAKTNERCAKMVRDRGGWGNCQCARKAKYPVDAPKWCKQHEPAEVARKKAELEAKHEALRVTFRRATRRKQLQKAAFEALLTGEGVWAVTTAIKAFAAKETQA